MDRIKLIKKNSKITLIILIFAMIGLSILGIIQVNTKIISISLPNIEGKVSKDRAYYINVVATEEDYEYDEKTKYYYVTTLTDEEIIVDIRTKSKKEAEKLLKATPETPIKFVGKAIKLDYTYYDKLKSFFQNYTVNRYGMQQYTVFDNIIDLGVAVFLTAFVIAGMVGTIKAKNKSIAFLKNNEYLNTAEADFAISKNVSIVGTHLIQTSGGGKITDLSLYVDYQIQAVRINFVLSHYNLILKRQNNQKSNYKSDYISVGKLKKAQLESFKTYLNTFFNNLENTEDISIHSEPINQGPDLE